MGPRRSLRKHVAMRDDNSTISSGLSSGAGWTYTMPNHYRTKSQQPSPVDKAQTKQLSKLPLPPRPKRSRSSRSMTDNCTVASGTTYTSRVSKVSIRQREPVLDTNDPLSKAMQDKIGEGDTEEIKSEPLPPEAQPPPAEHVPPQKAPSNKHGFTPLQDEEPLDSIDEGIPTQVISAPRSTVVLPPPPPIDSIESYSLGTNDFEKYNELQSSCRKWRLLVCLGSILLLLVIGGAVAGVLVVLKNKKDNEPAANANEASLPSMTPVAQPTPSMAPVAQPMVESPSPTASPNFSPISAPIAAPTDNDGSSPNDVPDWEALLAFFGDKDQAIAVAFLDTSSPQYRAMQWLEIDVQENQLTLTSASDRILQRGTLAIFYYSTLGDTQWTNKVIGWTQVHPSAFGMALFAWRTQRRFSHLSWQKMIWEDKCLAKWDFLQPWSLLNFFLKMFWAVPFLANSGSCHFWVSEREADSFGHISCF